MRPFLEVPVRSIIPPRQEAHTASPVRSVGPVVTLGGTTLGLRACNCRWTRAKTSTPTIGGTATSMTSSSGFLLCVFDEVRLYLQRPMYTVLVSSLWMLPTPNVFPVRVRYPRAFNHLTISLTPSGPDRSSPYR